MDVMSQDYAFLEVFFLAAERVSFLEVVCLPVERVSCLTRSRSGRMPIYNAIGRMVHTQ
jgi:hypothetical protein